MVFWARERLLHMGDLWLTEGPWRILRFVAAATRGAVLQSLAPKAPQQQLQHIHDSQ